MPSKWFKCPDGEKCEIKTCLDDGCRMGARCVPVPYLRLIGYDREWKGISPSQAGNDIRLIYLKMVKPYAIDPQDRAFAALGTAVHGRLSLHDFNVLAEEKLTDEQMRGIADLLSEENNETVLDDWKTWGSFKVAKALGLVAKDEPIIENGQPVLLKSGKNKGKPKTKKVSKLDPSKADLRSEIYQLNRYRIFFEQSGFTVNKMRAVAIVRDGGTYIAKSRGIDKNLYMIDVPYMDDVRVLTYYTGLIDGLALAVETERPPKCGQWESWDGRRCDGYCEVSEYCQEMGG